MHSPPRGTGRTGSLWTRSVSGCPTTVPPVRCSTTDSVNAGGKVQHHRQSNSTFVYCRAMLKTPTSTTIHIGLYMICIRSLHWLFECIMMYMKVNVVGIIFFFLLKINLVYLNIFWTDYHPSHDDQATTVAPQQSSKYRASQQSSKYSFSRDARCISQYFSHHLSIVVIPSRSTY